MLRHRNKVVSNLTASLDKGGPKGYAGDLRRDSIDTVSLKEAINAVKALKCGYDIDLRLLVDFCHLILSLRNAIVINDWDTIEIILDRIESEGLMKNFPSLGFLQKEVDLYRKERECHAISCALCESIRGEFFEYSQGALSVHKEAIEIFEEKTVLSKRLNCDSLVASALISAAEIMISIFEAICASDWGAVAAGLQSYSSLMDPSLRYTPYVQQFFLECEPKIRVIQAKLYGQYISNACYSLLSNIPLVQLSTGDDRMKRNSGALTNHVEKFKNHLNWWRRHGINESAYQETMLANMTEAVLDLLVRIVPETPNVNGDLLSVELDKVYEYCRYFHAFFERRIPEIDSNWRNPNRSELFHPGSESLCDIHKGARNSSPCNVQKVLKPIEESGEDLQDLCNVDTDAIWNDGECESVLTTKNDGSVRFGAEGIFQSLLVCSRFCSSISEYETQIGILFAVCVLLLSQ